MTMHLMTDQCSIASRVLPPGVHLRTGLLVATWSLTTDHRPGWSVPWLLCRPIYRWSLGYWQPITFTLVYLSPGPHVTLRMVHVVVCCWRHRLPMTDRIINHTTCTKKISYCKWKQFYYCKFTNEYEYQYRLAQTIFTQQKREIGWKSLLLWHEK